MAIDTKEGRAVADGLDPGDEEAVDAMNAKPDLEVKPDDERSIEEMAEAGLEVDEAGQLYIEGTKPTLTATAGRKKPDISTAKIAAISLPVRNQDGTAAQFDQEDELWVAVRVLCVDVNFKGETKESVVVRRRRDHVFKPLDVVPLPGGPPPS